MPASLKLRHLLVMYLNSEGGFAGDSRPHDPELIWGDTMTCHDTKCKYGDICPSGYKAKQNNKPVDCEHYQEKCEDSD